eukprot:bmy_00834T0
MGEADAADWEGKEHTSYQGQLNRHAARRNAVQDLILCQSNFVKSFDSSKIRRKISVTAYSPTTGTCQMSPFASPTSSKEQENKNGPSNGILRQITINDLPVGCSVDETLRLVQAFQFTDKHGKVCPAGWKPGSDTIKPDVQKSKEYFSKQK